MPELPEVETVRRALALHLSGRRADSLVMVSRLKLRRALQPALLAERLPGREFLEPRRRGKYLLLDTDAPGSLLVHLGMTGRLTVTARTAARDRHTHLVAALDNGCQLRFSDTRRFGFVHWLEPGEEERDPSLSLLGPEPLDPALAKQLPRLLKSRSVPVKSLLLDQRMLAGVGNIYATEALWRARIRPTRRGDQLSLQRLERLIIAVQEVLQEAIELGGTTIRDFVSADTSAGYFANRLQVYGRDGEPCPACGSFLRRSVIAGRSTVWCGRCQR